MGAIFLIVAIAFNAAANILLKLSADHGFDFALDRGVMELIQHNWMFIAGAFLFAINIFFYAAALRALPLSVAYPIMVGAVFVVVGAYAVVALHESLSLASVVGYALIIGGIVVVSAFNHA